MAELVEPEVFRASMFDRRQHARPRYSTAARSWSRTTGICLHQTACLLGERVSRWDTVGAHFGVTRAGKVIRLHDLDRVVVHGHGWNAQTVGIEIDGLYAGVEGDPATVWDDPTTQHREQTMRVTPEAMESARQLVRWIHGEVRRRGGEIRALVAHRQAAASRRNDPGSAIWQAVAIPMSAELGLSDGGAGFKLGDGLPIPEQWDPSRKGFRY